MKLVIIDFAKNSDEIQTTKITVFILHKTGINYAKRKRRVVMR